jgi:proton glutamate symport protein
MKLSLTAQCVLGLLLGVLVGLATASLPPETLSPWLAGADVTIKMWTNALRLVVLPLVITQLFLALAQRGAKGTATKLGVLIPIVFVGLLVFTWLSTIAMVSGFLRLPVFANLSLGDVAVAPASDAAGSPTGLAWLADLIPSNLFAAASANQILSLMLFTLAFALASRQLAPPLLESLRTAFQAVRDVMFTLVGWLLVLSPPILFALAFRSASTSGLEIGGALLAFLILWMLVLVLSIAAHYPIAALGAGIAPLRYARALFPAQMVAVATRSSVATVPVLLREAEATLRVPSKISALVIPLGSATLKLSQGVSPPIRLLFLAHLLGISIGPEQLVIFCLTVILMSPAIAGVPRVVSGSTNLPAYVAAGIPPEYVLLLAPLNGVVDFLLTALNTTGYMTANVLIARLVSSRSAPAEDGVVVGGGELAGEAHAVPAPHESSR